MEYTVTSLGVFSVLVYALALNSDETLPFWSDYKTKWMQRGCNSLTNEVFYFIVSCLMQNNDQWYVVKNVEFELVWSYI